MASSGRPNVVLINCVRRPAEIICRRRLELMASRVPSIKLHFIVEQEDPYDVWTGYRGRLNQLMLGLIASDYLEREVYCCGPEPFMQAVRDMLIALGFDMERYHQESFALAVETTCRTGVGWFSNKTTPSGSTTFDTRYGRISTPPFASAP